MFAVNTLAALGLAAAVALGAGAARAANPCAGVAPITTLAGLPFSGVLPANTIAGFMFDDETFDRDPAVTVQNLGSTVQSNLRILSLNTATGAFAGTLFGPWSGAASKTVTGTILPTNGAYFSFKMSYSVPVPKTRFNTGWTFTGAIRSVVRPVGANCLTGLFIAGTYTANTPSAVVGGGVSGPAPFSGAGFSFMVPN